MTEIRAKLFKKISSSKTGQEFMRMAKERGMDGEVRLQDVLWTVLFAGYGGTSNLVHNLMAHVLKDPEKQVQAFHADPNAYVFEGARHFPAVAGMNPWRTKDTDGLLGGKLKLPDGKPVQAEVGSYGTMST